MPRDGTSLRAKRSNPGCRGAPRLATTHPHLVPLTRALLDQVSQLGSDPLLAEIADRSSRSSEDYARFVLQPGLSFAALDRGYLLGAGGLVPPVHRAAAA